jgi:hypothetical protein
VKFMAKKKARQLIFPPLFVVVDTESRNRDPKGKQIRIRKKHPGSTTLIRNNGRGKTQSSLDKKKRYVEQT